MLHLLDESLETFLRAKVPLTGDVEVSFKAPDREWLAEANPPSVNLYLWDVRPNTQQRDGGVEMVPDDAGRLRVRKLLPRVDCRYVVTVWTSEVAHEHLLLGAILATLLGTDELEDAYLHEHIRPVRPRPTLEVGGDGSRGPDFWSALGNQLKPGLDLTVTMTVDAIEPVVLRTEVERYTVRTSTMDGVALGERRFRGERDEGRPARLVAERPPPR
jgi:hypothetical protein